MVTSNGTSHNDTFSMGPTTRSISRSELHGPIRAKVREGCRKRIPEAQQGVLLLKIQSCSTVTDSSVQCRAVGHSTFIVQTWKASSAAEKQFGRANILGGRLLGRMRLLLSELPSPHRQESYFHYLFGVEEEDYFGALDLRDGRTMLFMPRLPEAYAVWMGEIKGPEFYKQLYSVDAVYYADEILSVLTDLKPPALHVLHGQNTDSGRYTEEATFKGMEEFTVEREIAFPVLTECRVIKTREELEIMQYANDIASAAHVEVMRRCKPGMMEYQLEATFLGSCYAEGGCRHAPYTPICASGPRCAVLHYGHAGAPNNKQIRDGDIMLQDMGCEYYSYDSDITCSFPANGRFSQDQKAVYNAVLDAHSSVISAIKPGVSWPDMHLLAEGCILKGLKAAGVVAGDVEEMLSARIGALFMPHGLGHLLGIDTHDVGGYGPELPQRIEQPGLKSLRTARVLAANMVITVEPGCYFNPALLKPALDNDAQAAFLVKDRVLSLLGFGGVRLEDDVIVTETGAHSMTNVPRSVEDVEAVMAGAPWPRK